MKFLLDTMAIIYLVQAPDSLSPRARSTIEDGSNQLYISHVSPIEMQIKVTIDKLELGQPVLQTIRTEVARLGLSLLPITLDHIDALSRLPLHHRDPFDRLLIA